MGEWQPIASAPKDGTRILVCSALLAEEPEVRDHEIVSWAVWKPGWYNGDWTYEPDDFTHWMPLPEPPKT